VFVTLTIEQIIRKIANWQGKSVNFQPLHGGLTNSNYKVEVEGVPFVVRIPGASTELLAVDRQNEYYNTRAAAEAGSGPQIIHYLPDEKVMILEFITGQTMSIAALQAPGMPTRIAEALKTLHAGPRFLTDFNMFRLVEFYLNIVKEYEVRIPADYHSRLPAIAQIERAMAASPLPTVPCNNDLLAENYIDDGRRLWLLDYEYSGNNDPCFELGNTCQEQQYDEPRLVEMCAAYFGEAYPDKLARMKLNMIMSDAGWCLWAAIQAKISTIDFDFWGWAVERWARAEAKLDSPEFAIWLVDVARSK
jgi:thiamine kinase-like enzyme